MNYQAWLAHFPKITYSRYGRLRAYFFDLKNLYTAELDEIVKAGIEENIAMEFLTWRDKNPIEKILERMQKENIYTVSLGEDNYPPLLAQITDPPHTLFVRGQLPPVQQPTLGVVGTRRFTTYGKLVCEDLVTPLAAQGIVIVSGLALGIDGIAHTATLEAGGTTIAVLGSGINKSCIFPSAHRTLSEKIIEQGGAVVSEYPVDFAPTQYSFPARNRIIAGLSLGTLVIEAPAKSGALITARCALAYNREVMCVPHAITSPTGAGPNNLIKFGAKMVTEPNDILEALNLQEIKQIIPVKKENIDISTPEGKFLNCLTKEPKNINQIILETKIESAAMSATLTIMEIKGQIKNLGGMNYIKK
ncbi:MAG: DNA-processing protein DprA [Candidatus Magasanikbacteria bacterium]|nr:DNA-processing protein DprA [Candidatus Magasanikbacteria bacterium]